MTSLLPDESTYTTLARALVSLEQSNVIRYLPSFECCGSCAQWRFTNEDWGDSLGWCTSMSRRGTGLMRSASYS